MKKLMIGNEAVARGLWEAGVIFASSYPGTPSTEITEFLAKYDEVYAEWAPNEKVAAEAVIGASEAGGRAFCAMKHVGLNVAADPLFIMSYVGVGGGLVVGVADDPGMHSSQNEQDSRHYAISAKLPMLEPADSGECLEFAKTAYDLSEQFDTPFILRLTTRAAHSRSLVETSDRCEHALADYEKNPAKRVMMPGNARSRHVVVEERLRALVNFAETTKLNRIDAGSDTSLGIITAGNCYNYVKEAFGDTYPVLKLGMVNPLPPEMIKKFSASVGRVLVVEELDPVIETFVRTLGITNVSGKDVLPMCGEFSQELLREKILGEENASVSLASAIPGRPPVLCPGCPHRGVFYILNKMKLIVSGDIGCYTLGAVPPLSAMDSTYCMGASISSLHGFNKVRGEESESRAVAVIGDSTFMHSGLTGLANIIYNGSNSTVIILDNRITGMTGHQQNPLTGLTLKNTPAPTICLEDICAALGVQRAHIKVVDPADLDAVETAIKDELSAKCASVIICRRPCALLKGVEKHPPFTVDTDKCRSCKMCMKPGCPAISISEVGSKAVAKVDTSMCVGCGLCEQLCKFGALHGGETK